MSSLISNENLLATPSTIDVSSNNHTSPIDKKLPGKLLAKKIAEERRRNGTVVTQRMANLAVDGADSLENDRGRHGASNNNRSRVFVDWLVNVFELKMSDGDDTTPRRVLDVAGGKGETALRLSLAHNLPVTLCDPRVADFKNTLEKVIIPRLPKRWRTRLNDRGGVDGCYDRLVDGGLRQINCCFNDSLDPLIENELKIENNVKLIVGLHADNATEAIVKIALERKIRFAVVPCCVFPNFFTERRIIGDDGIEKPVRTVDDFVAYLCRLGDGIEVERLGFNGRNVVVYKKY